MVDAVDLDHKTNGNSTWRDSIRPLLTHYTERTPGSFVEEKEINLTWHYGNADPEFGQWQGTIVNFELIAASELQMNIEKILSHMSVTVYFNNHNLT